MVYLSPEVKKLCLGANRDELDVLRHQYRHIIPSQDLRWLDNLIAAKPYLIAPKKVEE